MNMEPVIIDPNFMRRETDNSESEATYKPREYSERAQQLALNGLGLVAPIAVDGSKAFLSTIKWLMVGLISVAAALMRDVARPFAAIVILLAASKLEQLAKWLDPKSETRIGSPRGTARRRSSNRPAVIQPAARARSAPRSHSSKSLVRADRGIGCMTPTRLAMRFPSELAAANARANSNDESGTQEGDILADDLSDLSVSVHPPHRSSAVRSSVLRDGCMSPKERKRRQGRERIARLRAQRKKDGKLV